MGRKRRTGTQPAPPKTPEAPTRPAVSAFPVAFVAALAAGALLRLSYLWQYRLSPYFEPALLDAGFYHQWAQKILRGAWTDGGAFFGLPLYPAFLAGVYKIAGVDPMAPRWIQLLLGVAHIGLIYKLTLRLFLRRDTAIVAAWIAALYAPYVFHEAIMIPESLGMFLYTAALLLTLRFVATPTAKAAIAVGLAVGLAGLTKAGVFFFVPFFFTGFLIRGSGDFQSRLRNIALIGAAVLLCVAPITLYNLKQSDDFVPLTWHGGLNLYIGNNPDASGIYATPPGIRSNIDGQIADSVMIAEREVGRVLKPSEVSAYWSDKAKAFVFGHPRKALGIAARKIALLVNRTEISDTEEMGFSRRFIPLLRFMILDFAVLFAAACAGLPFALKSMDRASRAVVLAWITTYAAGVALFFVNARYRLPIISALIPFGAYGITHAVQAVRSKKWHDIAYVAALATMATFVSHVQWVTPKPAVHFANAGNIYVKTGRPDRAVEMYVKAIEVDPDYAKAYVDLGAAYQKMGRILEAKAAFNRAIQKDPQSPYGYNNLGLILDAEGNSNRAVELFRKAVEVQPNLPEGHNNLGMVAAKTGDFDVAEKEFQLALALNPRSTKALTNLGLVHYYRGDKAAARLSWQQALRIDPNLEDAKKALQGLDPTDDEKPHSTQ